MKELKIRKQIRLPDYDYSENGYYFVTICSNNRQNIFGSVGAGLASARFQGLASENLQDISCTNLNINIKLSPIGKIIEQQWCDIPNKYDNIDLDEYVIMPNHIHGILVITTPEERADARPEKRADARPEKRADARPEKRADARPAPTISDVICSFKSRSAVECLKYIKQKNLNISGKIWQRSFYDHVIRSERSLLAIREYIAGNPLHWEKDIENLTRL